jgi:hypothetical protein
MSNRAVVRGDRVILSELTEWDYSYANPLGVVGTVDYIYPVDQDNSVWIEVLWDNGEINQYDRDEYDLIKVQEIEDNRQLSKGDRVTLLANAKWQKFTQNKLGIVGSVVHIGKYVILIHWDNGFENFSSTKDNGIVKVIK